MNSNKQIINNVLCDLATLDKNIVVLFSDSRGSASMNDFAEKFPAQVVEVGIAEQNLVSIAAGLASCGKKSFFNNPSKVAVCKELVKSFNGVSVREESLLQPCKEKLGIEAKWVLDPTMLLAPDDYLSATECCVEHCPIVFSYILDRSSEKDDVVNAIAKKTGYSVVNGNRVAGGSDKVFPSVDDWIQNINRAAFVVTDSFHGTVFSILFNKPFIAIGNVNRGMNRFLSLLGMFDLQERLVMNIVPEDLMNLVDKPIDFGAVNLKLSKEREKSLGFLHACLEE